MTDLSPRALKERSRQTLASMQTEARRVVIVYTAVLIALAIGSSGLNLYLNSQISGTGGLGGMGLRSVLQSIQDFMSYVNFLFDPFWGAGFLLAMVHTVRGQAPQVRHLAGGFRKIFRMVGYLAFQLLLSLALITLVAQLASFVFLMTPYGAEFNALMEPVMSDPNILTAEGLLNLDLIPTEALVPVMIPMFVIFGLIFTPVYIWLNYHFRMALYLLMTGEMGGTAAHLVSIRLMKGHKWQILKLDLSYWWYYLLGFAISMAAWLDVLLPLVGVELPFDPTVMFFATLILHCGLRLALNVWKKCEVDCTYVTAFEDILREAQESIQPQ